MLDLDAKSVHRRGALLLVVGGVDEDVVEDLVEDWDVGDCAVHNGAALVDPQRRALLHRADVDVRVPKDVIEQLLAAPASGGIVGGARLQRGLHRGATCARVSARGIWGV